MTTKEAQTLTEDDIYDWMQSRCTLLVMTKLNSYKESVEQQMIAGLFSGKISDDPKVLKVYDRFVGKLEIINLLLNNTLLKEELQTGENDDSKTN